MGLTVALGNALSGLKASQTSLEVISRNISNSGTPGYHKQTLNVIEVGRGDNSYVRAGKVARAFDSIIQNYYTKQLPNAAYSATRASFLDRTQTALGKPGSPGSLDTMLGQLETALDALATSPENYATRADMVDKAVGMVGTLNRLTDEIQTMRRETETRIATTVDDFNVKLTSLRDVNLSLADFGLDETTRASLLDQRDRLVSDIAEIVDLRVDYNSKDDTVRLGTLSGTTLLDVKTSVMEFDQAGSLTPRSEFSLVSDESSVGKLELVAPNGARIDLVEQGTIRSGRLGALIEVRDGTLQDAQRQLDDIAAGLAQVFSTVQRPGTTIANGVQLAKTDLDAVQAGNDISVRYVDAGEVERQVRLVNVASPATPPHQYTDTEGASVIELDLSGGAPAIAAALNPAAPDPAVFADLTFADDGSGNLNVTSTNAAVIDVRARTTATGAAGELGFNLFVDGNGEAFTDSLAGKGQRLGFAGRIQVSSDVLADNTLLVDYSGGGTAAGDNARVEHVVEQFQSLRFGSNSSVGNSVTGFKLSGTISDLVNQTVEYQGSTIASGLAVNQTNTQTLDNITSRMQETYGVDINEEISRLMELQNAYAANARVASVVQELLDTLMQSFS